MTKAKKARIQAALNELKHRLMRVHNDGAWEAIEAIQQEIGVEVKLKVKREVPHAAGS